mgnify:CR=1 FL=1
MKKYKVKVDGEVFEVSIEEMNSGNNSTTQQQQVETKVEKVEKEDNVGESTTQTSAAPVNDPDVEGEEVVAALPGTITSIEVSKGDQVSEGDVLFIHEAMKMENEITTPVSGTVEAITVKEGQDVDTDDVLAVIG